MRSTLRHYMQLPRPVHILCLGTFINRAGTMLLPFLTLYVHKQLDFGVSFATWTMGCYGFGSMVAAIVGGQLADAIGRRRIMLTALIGGSSVLIVLPFLRTQPSLLAGIVLFAFLAEMYRPAALAMIADLVEPARRPHAYGMMYFAINIGFSVGPLIAGVLITYTSYRWLIWFDAATALAYACIIWWSIAETLPRRVKGAAEGAAGNTEADIPPLQVAGMILRDRVFVVYCLAALSIGMVYMQAMSTLPLYLTGQGFTDSDYGQIIAVNGILITILQLPMASVLTRFDRARVIALASLLTGAGFFLTIIAVAKWHYMLTVVVWTVGEIMSAAFAPSIVADLAPIRLRARYMGVFSVCFSSANMIGAPLGGSVLERYGGNAVWIASFVLAAISSTLYLAVRKHIASKPAEATSPDATSAPDAIALPLTSSPQCAAHPADSTTAHPASGTTPQ